jgi:hypothetical protein
VSIQLITDIRFQNRTAHHDIRLAITIASTLISEKSKLIAEIKTKNDFSFDSGTGLEVAANLLTTRPLVPVFLFKSVNPFTSSLGYFDGKSIHINRRSIDKLSIVQLTGLMLHEYGHYCGFTHGNNFKTKDKIETSVPYFLSENIHRWI